MRFLKLAITVFFVAALFGCMAAFGIGLQTKVMVVGKARQAVDVSGVMIYLDPPSQYETVGLIEACCSYRHSNPKVQDRLINDVKSQAAQIGANGILLINTEKKNIIRINDGVLETSDASDNGISEWRAIHVISE